NSHFKAIALDDDCLLTKDLRNSLLGRVKEFASLSNLRTALINEGFVNFKIHYMGELWVLLEFDLVNSKNLFHDNIGVRSWFSQLKDASLDFNTDDFLEESNDDESDVESKGGDPKTHDLGSCGEDGDVVEVPGTLFGEERHSNDIPVKENTNPKENHLEDLFGIYSLLNKKKATIGEDGPSDQSPIYPPGFTLATTTNEPCTNVKNADNVNCSHQERLFTSVADHNAGPVRNSASQESMRDASESVCSGHFKKSVAPRTGGVYIVFDGRISKSGANYRL
ncbi:hypothetical protein Tco_1536906, partial [Tanacetum coccineum]